VYRNGTTVPKKKLPGKIFKNWKIHPFSGEVVEIFLPGLSQKPHLNEIEGVFKKIFNL